MDTDATTGQRLYLCESSNTWALQGDGGAGGGISNVLEDLTPQLGGDLDLNSQDITGTGNIDIAGGVTATGAGSFGVDGTTNAQITLNSADAGQGTILGAGDWWTDAVSYVRPAATDMRGAFDVMTNGTADEAHLDICGNDIVADPVNWQCLELLKNRDGEAVVAAKAGGTGTIKDLRLQAYGGRLMFGNTSDVSSNGIAQMAFTPGNQTSYIWANNGNSAGYFMGSGGMQFYNVANAGFGFYTNNSTTAKLAIENTGALTFLDNVRQTFNPGANAAGFNFGGQTADPDTPTDGDAFYDTDDDEIRARVNGAWQNLAFVSDITALQADDLVTLSGVSIGSTNLGTFTGATITDNQTVKAALQEVETALEGISGGISGLTTNTYPRAASSTTVEDGLIEDDGMDVTVNGGLIVTGSIQSGDGMAAGLLGLLEGTACTPATNEVCIYAPADVTTAYGIVVPAAVGATGVVKVAVSGQVATLSHAALADADIPNNITIDLAATATALAANPADCSVTTRFATSIAANGDLTCSQQIRQAHFKFWGTDTDFVLLDADDELSIFNNQLGSGITITEVTCESDAGTPTFQLQKDDGSPTNMLSSNLTCATTPASTTTFVSTENAIADGNRIDAHIVSAGGTAHWVAVTITYTVD